MYVTDRPCLTPGLVRRFRRHAPVLLCSQAMRAASTAVSRPGRRRQIHSFFRTRSPGQGLATAAAWTSPWLPPGYEQDSETVAGDGQGQTRGRMAVMTFTTLSG